MMSIMLTKLNYFIDLKIINPGTDSMPDSNVFYLISDLDSEEGIDRIKEIRGITGLKAIKIIGVYSSDSADIRESTFKAGCDAVMTKEEFINTFNTLMK